MSFERRKGEKTVFFSLQKQRHTHTNTHAHISHISFLLSFALF